VPAHSVYLPDGQLLRARRALATVQGRRTQDIGTSEAVQAGLRLLQVIAEHGTGPPVVEGTISPSADLWAIRLAGAIEATLAYLEQGSVAEGAQP
jgi:hypothetical protein